VVRRDGLRQKPIRWNMRHQWRNQGQISVLAVLAHKESLYQEQNQPQPGEIPHDTGGKGHAAIPHHLAVFRIPRQMRAQHGFAPRIELYHLFGCHALKPRSCRFLTEEHHGNRAQSGRVAGKGALVSRQS